MLLLTSSAAGPWYLVSGDYSVFLNDTQSVSGFRRVGVPVVSLTTTELSAIVGPLSPPVNADTPATYIDGSTFTSIDGGTPNSVFYLDDFDGGQADTTAFDDPPIDGNHP